jgi:hypothetical protein
MIKMQITGLNELQRTLKNISNRASTLGGTHKLSDVLTPSFIQQHSRFKSVEELIEASGFAAKNTEEFVAVPSDQRDPFIRANTTYRSWDEMLQAGSQIWVKKKMGL